MSKEIPPENPWAFLRDPARLQPPPPPARYGRAACATCGRDFQPKTKTHIRCSSRCSRAAAKEKANPRSFDLDPSTVGAMAEILACYDLMAHGYEVFRAMSPSASCDLIALKGGASLRVQVRTGYRNAVSGTLAYPWKPADEGRQDLYAIVIHATREVIYLDGVREAIALA